MYGSCATQLDLPSSDLDVVICGLPHSKSMKKKKSGDLIDQVDQYPYHGFQSVNGGRVLRLAGELEVQPWVVQVKAIPTASVPVIKILADPARLGSIGIIGGGQGHDFLMGANEYCAQYGSRDWMMESHGPSQMITDKVINKHESTTIQHNVLPGKSDLSVVPMLKPYPNPWRGADVMNGLISVDITFEGPEHGGVGSTAYSARVVQDACSETGLPPESTPVVQVTMVLKELLAQRRLNEPFSGGLSSYALLLMVVAIMQERKAIRAEMDLAERQRRAVAAPPPTPAISSMQTKNEWLNTAPLSSFNTKISLECSVTSEQQLPSAAESTPSSNSSWASIAKQTSIKRTATKEKLPQQQDNRGKSQERKRKESFSNDKATGIDDVTFQGK